MNDLARIDRHVEQQRDRDIDAYFAEPVTREPTPTPSPSEALRAVPADLFNIDCAGILLDELPITEDELRELMTDALEQLEEYPGEHSALFHSCAVKITDALLKSTTTYLENYA